MQVIFALKKFNERSFFEIYTCEMEKSTIMELFAHVRDAACSR